MSNTLAISAHVAAGVLNVAFFLVSIFLCLKARHKLKGRRTDSRPILPVSDRDGTAVIPLQDLDAVPHPVAGPIPMLALPSLTSLAGSAVVAPSQNTTISIGNGAYNNVIGPITHSSSTDGAVSDGKVKNGAVKSTTTCDAAINRPIPVSRRTSDTTGIPRVRMTAAPPRPLTPPASIWLESSANLDTLPCHPYTAGSSRLCLLAESGDDAEGLHADCQDSGQDSFDLANQDDVSVRRM